MTSLLRKHGDTDRRFFKGDVPMWKQDTFLEVAIVPRKPSEAAFDTEEKTVSQALTD